MEMWELWWSDGDSCFRIGEYEDEEIPSLSEDSLRKTIQAEIYTLSLDKKFTPTGDPCIIAQEILRMMKAGELMEAGELGCLNGKAVYVQVLRSDI